MFLLPATPMALSVIDESKRLHAVTLHRVQIFDLAGVARYRSINGTIPW
jgi:hypothetical protein